MACNYKVALTPAAEKTYIRLCCLAQACLDSGDDKNSKVLIFKKLVEALEKTIPEDPFNPERALSGALGHIFRVGDEPIRVYYIGKPQDPKIVVIRIADTILKSGYNFFAKWVMSSNDAILAQFGIQLPDRSQIQRKPITH